MGTLGVLRRYQDNQLVALRAKYELLAAAVLDDHLDLIEAAINRRFFSCGGFSKDEAFEKYVNALSEFAEKWQEIVDTDDDESKGEAVEEPVEA